MSLFAFRRPVLFQDVDAARVVYFAHFFSYFHDTYVAWLASLGLDLPSVLAEGKWIAPLVHAEADYTHPLRFGDAMVVEIEHVELGASSMKVSYRVRSPDGGRSYATGKTVHAFVDPATMKKCAPPARLAEALVTETDGGAG